MATSASASASASAKRSRATAPMPKKPPRRSKVPCGVCQGPIVDGKDDALLCEGDCGLWYHRGCASVHPNLYKELSDSSEPFVCLSCTNSHLKREIALLREELQGVAEVRDKCAALVTEVAALRLALNSIVEVPKPQTSRSTVRRPKRTYANAVRAAQFPNSANSIDASSHTVPSAVLQQEQTARNVSPRPREARPKIKVDGARKIWGTVQSCSAGAIVATISRLIPTKVNIQVRRKTKTLANNKSVWWFVVHGAEGDLTILEQEWDRVRDQTLWSLQNCYMSPNTTPLGNCASTPSNLLPQTPANTKPSDTQHMQPTSAHKTNTELPNETEKSVETETDVSGETNITTNTPLSTHPFQSTLPSSPNT